MKIKHLKEHDEIVQWILNNPETLLKSLGLNDSFTNLSKHIQVNVMKNTTSVGTFDVQLRYEYLKEENSENENSGDSIFKRKQLKSVNIIINVKMESATEQLREYKKIYLQHKENTTHNRLYDQLYVIVSTNDTFKTFFTDNNFTFYKYK